MPAPETWRSESPPTRPGSGRAPVTTVVRADAWPDPAEALPDPADNTLAQPYGGYISPGSTLDEVRVFVSQWNTTSRDRGPYRVIQFAVNPFKPGSAASYPPSQQVHKRHLAVTSLPAGIMRVMSETTEPLNEPTEQVATVNTPPPAEPAEAVVVKQKPNRLYQSGGLGSPRAGTLLIVSVIFFWGFVLGRHSGGPGQHGHHGQHHGESSMSDRGGPGRGPMMWPGPGGHGPGNFGPGRARKGVRTGQWRSERTWSDPAAAGTASPDAPPLT